MGEKQHSQVLQGYWGASETWGVEVTVPPLDAHRDQLGQSSPTPELLFPGINAPRERAGDKSGH